jgi:hypothetical protein
VFSACLQLSSSVRFPGVPILVAAVNPGGDSVPSDTPPIGESSYHLDFVLLGSAPGCVRRPGRGRRGDCDADAAVQSPRDHERPPGRLAGGGRARRGAEAARAPRPREGSTDGRRDHTGPGRYARERLAQGGAILRAVWGHGGKLQIRDRSGNNQEWPRPPFPARGNARYLCRSTDSKACDSPVVNTQIPTDESCPRQDRSRPK